MISYELNLNKQPIGLKVENWIKPNLPEKKNLIGNYCILEPLNLETHSKDLYEANSLDKNYECWTYLNYGPFDSYENYLEWLKSIQNSNDPIFYTIIDKVSSKAVGLISYLRIDQANGSIEIGHLNFSNRLKKTKAATEAIYLMLNYVFELGYRRFEWKCNSLNFPSRVAAQRYGFSFEGTFRQHAINKGRNRDTTWYSILDNEFILIKKAFEEWLDENNFDGKGIQKKSLSNLTKPLLKNIDEILEHQKKF